MEDLTRYYNEKEIIEATFAQIKKDFEMFSFEVVLDGDGTPYEQLFRAIRPYISQLLDKDYGRLLSLLYRIDLPEGKLNATIQQRKSDPIADVISDLIIQRELHKVLLRRKYSG